MSPKIYLTILKSGIYLVFLSVFLVFNNFLFPYITSKQIYFNILTEVLAVFWLAFIIKYPEYRPKKSWITVGLIFYFAAILISSIASVDFNLSFWGDIERMLGFFNVFHFLIFYLIVITAVHSPKDWYILMLVSVVAATIESSYALSVDPSGTIGNRAYVGGYLIFNIYFVLILFFRTKRENFWRWAYLFAVIPMLFAMKKTGVAGAYVGFGLSVILGLFFYGVLNKERKIKIWTLSIFVIAIVLVSALFLNRNNPSVRSVKFFNDMLTEISVGKNTFQTRLIAWRTAWKDFPKHPLVGTGYGNFAITFDKYFEPTFYNYTRAETYFDRAHNNLVDIASTTGLLGLLTYLSIFAAVAYYLIAGFRKKIIGLNDFALLSSLIAAYFIQNLAVFDSLVTYIALMVALGYLYWLYRCSVETRQCLVSTTVKDEPLNNKEIYTFLAAGLIILFVMYQYNIKVIKMLSGTIAGQMAFAQSDIVGGVEAYKKALSYNTVLDRDSRDSLIRLMSNINLLNQAGKEKGGEIVEYVKELSEKNLKYNPADSLALLEHAQFLNIAAEFFKDDKDKFSYYSNLAEEAINRSIESAPGRIPHYFVRAQVFITRGDFDKAIETIKYAVTLNEDYYESVCKLAKIQIVLKKDEGYDNMNQCVDKGGIDQLAPSGFVAQLINSYVEKKDSVRVLKLYERMAQLEPKDAKILANLAQLYAQAGQIEKAVETALKAAELDPSLKDAAEEFIKNLELKNKN